MSKSSKSTSSSSSEKSSKTGKASSKPTVDFPVKAFDEKRGLYLNSDTNFIVHQDEDGVPIVVATYLATINEVVPLSTNDSKRARDLGLDVFCLLFDSNEEFKSLFDVKEGQIVATPASKSKKAAPKKEVPRIGGDDLEKASEKKSEAVKQPMTRPTNSGKRWNDKDEETLVNAVKSGKTPKQIAELLGRTERSIEYRIFYLIEMKLNAKGFSTPSEYDYIASNLCEEFHTTTEAFEKYLNFNKMRKERHTAKVLAKHKATASLRQFKDGLYVKVAHVPSSKELKAQLQVKELNDKIEQLEAQVADLTAQLRKAGKGKGKAK